MALTMSISLLMVLVSLTSLVTSRTIDRPPKPDQSIHCAAMAKVTPWFCNYEMAKWRCATFCAYGDKRLDCGWKGDSYEKRSSDKNVIDDSSAARPGEWPWHVSMRVDGKFWCSGTILTEYHILTAQRCFEGEGSPAPLWKGWVIHAGDYLLDTMDEGEENRTANGLSTGEYRKGEVVEVERNDGNVVFRVDHSDIAVLQLKKPLNLHDYKHIGRVCLPDKHYEIYPGSNCKITGWGHKWGAEHSESNELREKKVEVISRGECNERKNYDGHINPTVLCAGKRDTFWEDGCPLDVGGPLVCEYANTWHQHGIVSSNGACDGDKIKYGLYADVGALKEFVVNAVLSF